MELEIGKKCPIKLIAEALLRTAGLYDTDDNCWEVECAFWNFQNHKCSIQIMGVNAHYSLEEKLERMKKDTGVR